MSTGTGGSGQGGTDSMDAPPLRWGVIGPGWIAERFVQALHRSTRQQVVAVGSRSPDRSREFASRLQIPRAHGSYQALVDDANVDVVYVAVPHNAHHACALLALEAGKHTLVEKPLALNAAQARDLAAATQRRGVFCMEAMWSFFLPKFAALRDVIGQGMIGELRTVIADHGEHFGPDHRIMRPELAGGPLLDLGTYPVALATALLGEADEVLAIGQPAASGVQGQISVLLAHPGGNQSVIHTSILSNTPSGATIAGTGGTLTIPGVFYMPGDFTVQAGDGTTTFAYREPPTRHEGLHYQAAEVARCVHAGLLESPTRPLAASVSMMSVLDRIRERIGTVYDEDRPGSAGGS
jgi:predicted dehydrogenase